MLALLADPTVQALLAGVIGWALRHFHILGGSSAPSTPATPATPTPAIPGVDPLMGAILAKVLDQLKRIIHDTLENAVKNSVASVVQGPSK